MQNNYQYNNNNANKNKGIPWWVVIVVFIVFWPVGLYLLYRKLNTSKSSSFNNGTGLLIASVVLYFFSFAYLDLNYAGAWLFCVVGGTAMLAMGIKMRRRSKRFRTYMDCIVNMGITNMDEMAARSKVKHEKCSKDLQKMIDLDILQGTIDGTRRVFIPAWVQRQQNYGYQPYPQSPQMAAPSGVSPSPQAPQAMQCKNCGANNSLSAGQMECEYCGSPLK